VPRQASAHGTFQAPHHVARGADASASSTVCRAYSNELKRSTGELAQNPADRGLQQKVDAYNRIIADACN